MKKKTTRLLAILLCCVMIIGVAACGSKTDDNANSNTNTNTDSNANANTNTNTNTDSNADTNTNPNSNSNNVAENTDNMINSTPAPEGVVSARDTLKVAGRGDAGSLLPNAMSPTLLMAARQYCEPLWDYDHAGNLVYVLAESVDGWDSDVLTIHLRQGVKFSNGSDFTAEDLVFSINFHKAYIPGQLREFNMERSRIIDDYTFELVLDPYGFAPQFGFATQYIYDAETFNEEDFVMHPVGTGPYEVVEYVINSHIYMKARDDYWGEKAKIENLQYLIFNEDAQVTNAIQAGTVDIVPAIPAQDIEYAKTLPGYDVMMYATNAGPNLTYNLNPVSIMNNYDARMAVNYAFNREAVLNLVYFGYGSLLLGPVADYCIDHEPRLEKLNPVYTESPNMELAKEYAEKAGIIGKDIVVVTNGMPNYVTTAEILQSNMNDIGVNIVINNYDNASYTSVQQDPEQYDILVTGSGSPSRLGSSILCNYIFWSPWRYENGWPAYDEYYELARKIMENPNSIERKEQYYELSKMFAEYMLWLGICNVESAMAINENLGGRILWTNAGMRFNEWYWVS
ncbi:MAG: ABC transporter substrate-binding protein [Oscillospiraceae bacterium]|nr:ABC transporter substrate-binding protein [Oscillospiraceae bacterium]